MVLKSSSRVKNGKFQKMLVAAIMASGSLIFAVCLIEIAISFIVELISNTVQSSIKA